ncbi:glycosyltransferase 87 family protein [Streptomyces liangshanensis]|uniref:glycosyltransferase 87 family protein n=1 Tax=Streptomyces liangshanensis TaxID=2717324 RepID=UPI0036D77C77
MTTRTVTARSLVAVGLLALSFAAFAALCLARRVPMADTLVYRAEGAAVVDGTDLYGFTVTEWRLPATYPPFAAILFVPTTWPPVGVLKCAFVVGNLALLALLVRLSGRFAGLRYGGQYDGPCGPVRPARHVLPYALPIALPVAAGLALWLEPVFQTVLFGQINLALACLVLWDLSRPEHAVGKGFALGVAAGIKLTPAIFIVYLLVTRRVRAGLTALASLTGTVLLGALVLPRASADFWTRRVFETDRVGKAWIVDNQSLRGLLSRVLHTTDPGAVWAVAAALTAAAGLWLARRVFLRHGLETWGVLVTALTALLVSPISWSHHWVWCVPLLAVLIAEGHHRTAAAAGVVWTARTLWAVPHRGDLDLRLPWWQQPLASPYPLAALALLAWIARRTADAPLSPAPRRPPPRHPAPRPPTPQHPAPQHPAPAPQFPASSSSASTIR